MALDFIFHLPKTKNNHDGILTVIDKLTRAVKLTAVSETGTTATTTAYNFRKRVFSDGWGVPRALISDQDVRFLSAFWQELHRLLGTQLRMTSTYHPAADGAVERVHRLINESLRAFASVLQSQWDEYLDLLEFAINNSVCSSTGFTPFFLLYLQHPRLPSTLRSSDLARVTDPTLVAHLRLRQEVMMKAKRAVVAAQARQKQAHDAKRDSPQLIEPGCLVLLSNAPFALTKVSPKWLGPFSVTRMRGKYTAELNLPEHWQVHPVFHISHLRLAPASLRSTPRSAEPVPEPPARIELIISHFRTRGRGGPLHFHVKFADEPLKDPLPTLSLPEALSRAPALVQAYLTTHNLTTAGGSIPLRGGDEAGTSTTPTPSL